MSFPNLSFGGGQPAAGANPLASILAQFGGFGEASGGFMPGGAPGVPGAAGGVGGIQGLFDKIGGMEGLGQIAQGLSSLGSLYGGFKGIGLAEDQFNFSKKAYETNLGNSRQAYNTSLEDRINARYATEGRGAGAVQGYLNKHSL